MKLHTTIRTRFTFAGGLLMAMCVAVGSVALFGVRGLQDAVAQLTNRALPGVLAFSKVEANAVTHSTATNAEQSAAAAQELSAQSQALADIVARLSALVA